MSTRRRGRVVRVLMVAAILLTAIVLARRAPAPEASTASAPSAGAQRTSGGPASSTPGVSATQAGTSEGGSAGRSEAPGSDETRATEAAAVASADARWREVADRFITAYADVSGGQQAWLARLQPLSSTAVLQGFSYTNIDNLPGGTPGPASVIVHNEEAGGTARYQLDAGSVAAIDVTVAVASSGQLLVTAVVPVLRTPATS